jgi:hypothetical protein
VATPSTETTPAVTIDCEACAVQYSDACDDCIVSYLVSHDQGSPVILNHDEKHAVDLLADAGLVPPSRFEFRPRLA